MNINKQGVAFATPCLLIFSAKNTSLKSTSATMVNNLPPMTPMPISVSVLHSKSYILNELNPTARY